MATTMSGDQVLMDDSERIHWTSAESRSDSGLSFEMMTPGATPSRRDRDEFRTSNGTDDLEAALKAEGLLTSRPSVKEVKIENDANGWYDILLLSIGLLINMLETNVRRRHQLTDQGTFFPSYSIAHAAYALARPIAMTERKRALTRSSLLY